MYESEVKNFHDRGLSACLNLQSYVSVEGAIRATDYAESWSICSVLFVTPASLSALTKLSNLALNFLVRPGAFVDLDWLTKLPALQNLRVSAYVMCLPQSLSLLTSLRHLHLDLMKFDQGPNVSFNFEWSSLISLQNLHVQSAALSRQSMRGLACLQTLRSIELSNVAFDPFTGVEIALLALHLGRHRPDVNFCISSCG